MINDRENAIRRFTYNNVYYFASPFAMRANEVLTNLSPFSIFTIQIKLN